jgi:8-oxo-dGTP pyrophosphatase MutT (NUDIX family)
MDIAEVDPPTRQPLKSCGFLVFRREPVLSFLLMRHPDRWDLPKGHMDDGETELETALRELEEETGFRANDLSVDEHFRFSLNYTVRLEKSAYRPQQKELVVFLGTLRRAIEPELSVHESCRWFEWDPPHQIQLKSIDPLLDAVNVYWSRHER